MAKRKFPTVQKFPDYKRSLDGLSDSDIVGNHETNGFPVEEPSLKEPVGKGVVHRNAGKRTERTGTVYL